jgi:hypothetical protein
MKATPGTVSKILWHFTRGPLWDEAQQCQQRHPKPADDAYAALVGILRSKQLRLGRYREVVRVRLPQTRRDYPLLKLNVSKKNNVIILESAPVCCLADIPVAHLAYHAGRYGKIAVGFHREVAVEHGFNPVLYAVYGSDVLKALHRSFRELDRVSGGRSWTMPARIASDLEDLKCDQGHPVDLDDVRHDVEELDNFVGTARRRLQDVLAFVKTFHEREFGSIYCEREWRATTVFPFELSDVAMIVLPKGGRNPSYLDQFISECVPDIRLPRSTPIVPWEDLIEH